MTPAEPDTTVDELDPKALRINPTDKHNTQSRQSGMVATQADLVFFHQPEQHGGETGVVYRIDVPTLSHDVRELIADVDMPDTVRNAILAKLGPVTHVQILAPEGHVLPMMWMLAVKRDGPNGDTLLRYRPGMIAKTHSVDE